MNLGLRPPKAFCAAARTLPKARRGASRHAMRSSREWRAGYAPQCARLMDELGVATPEGLLRCCEDTSESSEVRVKACYEIQSRVASRVCAPVRPLDG